MQAVCVCVIAGFAALSIPSCKTFLSQLNMLHGFAALGGLAADPHTGARTTVQADFYTACMHCRDIMQTFTWACMHFR
eukprot:1160735-Pelagomonas_calceolata.AAC.4